MRPDNNHPILNTIINKAKTMESLRDVWANIKLIFMYFEYIIRKREIARMKVRKNIYRNKSQQFIRLNENYKYSDRRSNKVNIN